MKVQQTQEAQKATFSPSSKKGERGEKSDQDEEASLAQDYLRVRALSLKLCEPLKPEDYQVQPMEDASPPKWHLAHVTWFFETFILRQLADYKPFHPEYEFLFNSYYNGVGDLWPRARRGFLSRPDVNEIMAYRKHVDEAMLDLLDAPLAADVRFRILLGLNHEQQHQELLLTDMKYNLGMNPLKPAYLSGAVSSRSPASQPLEFLKIDGGEHQIGADASAGFIFDNESPVHAVLLGDFELSNRLVTNAEYIEFIEDGGYERHELWLSDGWAHMKSLQDERWQAPLYWSGSADGYAQYQLKGGESEVDLSQPVCHVSGYEADAFARWKGCRLPTEAEWEVASQACDAGTTEGNFVESERYHPAGAAGAGLTQMYGDAWEWTSSSYSAYPGYKPLAGQLGEYNGKFMANQLVLRGGSCATPADHVRSSYRNFFYPPDRWQFSGIRLARDA